MLIMLMFTDFPIKVSRFLRIFHCHVWFPEGIYGWGSKFKVRIKGWNLQVIQTDP